MNYVFFFLCFFVGLAFGYFFTFWKLRKFKMIVPTDYDSMIIQIASSKAQLVELEKKLKSEKDLYGQLEQKQKHFFEQLSQKMMLESADTLRDKNEKSLAQILSPLREKLSDFQKKVEDSYSLEARERFALKKELERISEINLKMSTEANNLTKALKGDVKAQGNWGEIILEKILESAGLREGEEFTLQGKNLGLQNEEGKSLRPDAIVHLPDNKHLIIDSKVSLLSFERYSMCEDETLRAKHLNDYLTSVQNHVRDLSEKHYQSIQQLHSPDFVFLFMPVEAAFLLYLQADKEGMSRAWNKKIMITSPSTLWPCLKTVSSLWKTERQTRNALEIAQQAGSLYDKFVGFLEDFAKIGKTLSDAQRSYDESFAKLRTGKGNLIRQTEKLKELGVKTKKKIEVESLDSLDDLSPPTIES